MEENYKFCPNCGHSIGGLKTRINIFGEKVKQQARSKANQFINSIDNKIEGLLSQLDNTSSITIAGHTIPENEQESVRNALLSFKQRIGKSDTSTVSVEFQQWLDDLPKRLEVQKCIVCFVKWTKEQDIVVCRYCQNGGHQGHLTDWIQQKQLCPLCRKNLTLRDLIKVKIP